MTSFWVGRIGIVGILKVFGTSLVVLNIRIGIAGTVVGGSGTISVRIVEKVRTVSKPVRNTGVSWIRLEVIRKTGFGIVVGKVWIGFERDWITIGVIRIEVIGFEAITVFEKTLEVGEIVVEGSEKIVSSMERISIVMGISGIEIVRWMAKKDRKEKRIGVPLGVEGEN